jgi:hypothetical protein
MEYERVSRQAPADLEQYVATLDDLTSKVHRLERERDDALYKLESYIHFREFFLS